MTPTEARMSQARPWKGLPWPQSIRAFVAMYDTSLDAAEGLKDKTGYSVNPTSLRDWCAERKQPFQRHTLTALVTSGFGRKELPEKSWSAYQARLDGAEEDGDTQLPIPSQIGEWEMWHLHECLARRWRERGCAPMESNRRAYADLERNGGKALLRRLKGTLA